MRRLIFLPTLLAAALSAVTTVDPATVHVRYAWAHKNGRVCDGEAMVSVAERRGVLQIERIRALSGC